MKLKYDAEIDGLSIIFLEATVTTHEAADWIAIEYDAEGRMAGIEILDARQRFGETDPLRSVTREGVALTSSAAPAGCASRRPAT